MKFMFRNYFLLGGGEFDCVSHAVPEQRRTRQMNVKRFGLWVAGIGVLVSIGLLTVEQGYTEEKQRATKCTLATLTGRYLFALTGTLFPQRKHRSRRKLVPDIVYSMETAREHI
jgi:hypothetical protein